MLEILKTLSGFRRKPETPSVDDLRREATQRKMLITMQGRPIYGGTAGGSKAQRRARGKMAKQSRKINRGR